MAVAAMSMIDLYLTVYSLTTVGLAEENPLARAVMQTGSPVLISLWKIMTLIPAIGLLWRFRWHRSAEIGAWVGALILSGVMLHWHLYLEQAHTIVASIEALEAGIDARWVSAVHFATP